MNKETEKRVADLLLWSDGTAKQLMIKIAGEHGVSVDALAELVAWERDQQESIRKRGRTEAFNEIFENKTYWK
ncbi:DNA modification system-associated small protein [Neisseria yangbaofengii]|uniref:DNA modification system-associated small protein n=1 Tax=Neisseria yangbaofengii TaxID=2709396 RepID=UPI0013EC3E0F|nr:DNA modification system-associated small protein [Neisseria yangbaofengii]